MHDQSISSTTPDLLQKQRHKEYSTLPPIVFFFSLADSLWRPTLGLTHLTGAFYHGKESATISTVMLTILATCHDAGQDSSKWPKENAAKAGPKPSK